MISGDLGPALGVDGALSLLHAWLPDGALAGLADIGPDGDLVLIDVRGCAAPDGLRMGELLEDGEAEWLATDGRRLSTAWTLALGARPSRVATVRVPGTAWAVVAALPAAQGPPAAPDPGLLALVRGLVAEAAGDVCGVPRAQSRQRARLELLVRSLATPLVFLGFRDGEVMFNPTAAALLGLRSGEDTLAAVVSAVRGLVGEANLLPAIIADAAVGAGGMEIERDGSVWLLRGQRLQDPLLSGLLWQFADITQLRRNERAQLDAAQAQTMARLAGGIAHDFNNLLTVVIGHAEALSGEACLGASAQRRLDDLVRAAERGVDLVAQLMAFGPGRASERRRIDLGEELRRILPLLAKVLPPDIAVDVRESGAPVWLDCERGVLADTVVNLALNARDAMPAGGRLVIAVDHVDDGRRGRLCVSDDGRGMPPDVLARAREPFYSTKGLASGRGLGLAVAESFARRHGGELRISSAPGRGTTVELLLPTADAPGD